uniref:Uncharacterized protein n=1 Tax=Arundo donax TaxID=35708 RepID=A0A0A9CFA2_ARUDO
MFVLTLLWFVYVVVSERSGVRLDSQTHTLGYANPSWHYSLGYTSYYSH